MMDLQPSIERVGIDTRYQWDYPLPAPVGASRKLRCVWYVALPLTTAHRGSHSGGGAVIEGAGSQSRYLNEGTVYPHASLIEMITYQELCFPSTKWRYVDMSHHGWDEVKSWLSEERPDVIALTTYSATALWAYVVAAEAKRVNPQSVVVLGNDHAGILHREILTGTYGQKIVDFVSTGNNGPFTMMGLLFMLQGQLSLERVPSIAYRHGSDVINQAAPTFPLRLRILPDYRLIESELEQSYDRAFAIWYTQHYELKRMITLPLDSGCHWGSRPTRRCRHCSIQGLTPKTVEVPAAIRALEVAVGELGANVYAAGDSTLGFSSEQWGGNFSYLNALAEECARSPVLRRHRFMLAYGLPYEFLQAADLCKGFIRTWNVGLEAFDPTLLKGDSKGINKDADRIYEALELASRLDYKIYASGIMGLAGTTIRKLRSEVDQWLALAERYQNMITTVSVAAPAVIPGSRMYWEMYQGRPEVRAWHGELIASRKLTELYIRSNTEVQLADVEAALADLGRGIITLSEQGSGMKFGGYMLGGSDTAERLEWELLEKTYAAL